MSNWIPTRKEFLDALKFYTVLLLVVCPLCTLVPVASTVTFFLWRAQQLHNPATKSGGVRVGNGEVALDLWVSDPCPQDDETITLRATVTNKTNQTQVLQSGGQPVLNLAIGGPERTQTQWSDGKMLTPDLTHLELQPGQSKSIDMNYKVYDTWNAYYASATLSESAASWQSANVWLPIAARAGHGCVAIDLP
jgi:Intracellular proteinase inhibitor